MAKSIPPVLATAASKLFWTVPLGETLRLNVIGNGSNLARVEPRYDPATGNHSIAVVTNEIPPQFGLALGDIIHNMRSALDAAMSGIVKGDDADYDRRVNFPIAKDERYVREYFSAKGKGSIVQKKNPSLAEFIANEIRPWESENPDLYNLSRLDNLSKHNIVLFVFGKFRFSNFNYVTAENSVFYGNVFVVGPGEDFPIGVSKSPIQFEVGEVSARLEIAPGQPFEGEEIFELLPRLGKMTQDVLNRLAAKFC